MQHRNHTSYIKTNNPISAVALSILNNINEYGNADQTIQLLIPCDKQNTLIDEEKVNELNPLYTFASITR